MITKTVVQIHDNKPVSYHPIDLDEGQWYIDEGHDLGVRTQHGATVFTKDGQVLSYSVDNCEDMSAYLVSEDVVVVEKVTIFTDIMAV